MKKNWKTKKRFTIKKKRIESIAMYTKEDLKEFKKRGVKSEDIDRQVENFRKGFNHVNLTAPAGIGNGIKSIPAGEEEYLINLYEQGIRDTEVVKMVPASGSATRMFKSLFTFLENYTGTTEDFLTFVQDKTPDGMYDFFANLHEFPFYARLKHIVWEKGADLEKMLEKRMYKEVLGYILGAEGLNYGNTPKGLVDFHVYRDFVRTAFDEHLVEAALYCKRDGKARLHFTVSEEYVENFKKRLDKVTKVFEKMFDVKYDVSFSIQKPSTDTVSMDEKGELVRDGEGKILFRPGGHGALIYNLNEIKADVIFIKNIDNVIPDRSKNDTVRFKKLLGGILLETQSKVFEQLERLEKKDIRDSELDEIEAFIENTAGYRKPEGMVFPSAKERAKFLHNILNRPIRICGMVKNQGEPGGGPFWVKSADGSSRLMIIESAQVNLKDEGQKKIFSTSTHFNPVDIVCGTRDHKGKRFDLTDFIDHSQGFITNKSYKGKEIKVQELPGLWNGSMAQWTTVFVEVPLSTFTPVKTVFDLRRQEHMNVFSKL